MFVIELLQSMKTTVKLQVTIRVDNIGAIFMERNATIASHSKHMDMWQKYVSKYAKDGVVKIVFVKPAENESNILVKSLSGDLDEKHSTKMISDKPEWFSKIEKNDDK